MAGGLSKCCAGEGKQQFGRGRSGVEQTKETYIIEGRAMREWEREWKGEEGSGIVDAQNGTVCILGMNMWTVRFFKMKMWTVRFVQTEMWRVRLFKMEMWSVRIFKIRMWSVCIFRMNMWSVRIFKMKMWTVHIFKMTTTCHTMSYIST